MTSRLGDIGVGDFGDRGDTFFVDRVVACGCSACVMMGDAVRDDAARGASSAIRSPHVMADAGSANEARGFALLTQYQEQDGSWAFSGDRNVDAVLIGTKWTGTELTFAFPSNGDVYGQRYDMGQHLKAFAFNDLQQDAARDGLAMVASYTNLVFTEVAADAERPTLRFAQSADEGVPSALGHFPNSATPVGAQNPSGDIWFGRSQQPFYTDPAKGNWGYVTVLHEIGHALGLKHGQDDYTEFDLGTELFGTDSPLYGTRSLEYGKNGQAWSLMTYTPAPGSTGAFNGDRLNAAQSYMQYDIAALQYLYGANYTTEAGDTVYRWSPVTGEKFVNGVGQGAPTGNRVFETVWDGGGIDTYDLSAYEGGVVADLRPGAFVTLPEAQQANARGYADGYQPVGVNIGNALLFRGDTRSLIENAIGGAGDDRITGNQADNRLAGNEGDDVLDGGTGSDVLLGGAGTDIASFSTATTGIAVTLNGGVADILVGNGADTDRLQSIEGVIGTAYDDVLTGDDGDNTLGGGAGGADVLRGGAGDDRLIGGGFVLVHDDLPDVRKDGDTANATIDAAIGLDGHFDLVPRSGVEVPDLPHATVVATSAVDGSEYYRFTGRQGATVVLDIDGIDEDATLQIVDARGRVLAQGFATGVIDDGSDLPADPGLSFVLPEDGVYYVVVLGRVQEMGVPVPAPLPAATDYVLHVSLEHAETPVPQMAATASAAMEGGAGADVLVATMGDDRIDGGVGVDTLSYEQAWRGVTVDLARADAQDTAAGRDTIRSVENLTGSRHADRLSGDARANVIDGGGGGDVLDGGAGTDTISFASQARGVRFDLAQQGAAQAVRLGEAVEARGFENLTGTAFDDTLAGDLRANVIDGGAGNDVLVGDVAGRIGARDRLIGGEGDDTATFAGTQAAVVASLREDGTGYVTAGGFGVANLDGIENLVGGGGGDSLRGNALANRLSGGAGDDRIEGGGGDDRLVGGAGDDLLLGGAGTDLADFTDTLGASIDLRRTGWQDTGAGRDRLIGIENLALGRGTNSVTGSAEANTFFDGGGDDRYDGQGGVDTIDYSSASGRLVVDLSLAEAQDTGGAGADTIVGIENVVAGAFGSRLTGTSGANVMIGGAGRDIIIAGDGRDTLRGGDGADVLIGDVNAVDDLSQVDRADTIEGGQGNDLLVGGQGDDVLIGGTGNDFLIGGSYGIGIAPDDSVFLDGYSILDGGNDVIDGGEGVDVLRLQFGGRTQAVAIDLSVSARVNTLYSAGVAVGSVTNVERATIIGGEGDDRFVGTTGYDTLDGGAGDDTLIGGLGDDVLSGGAGNDLIDGGEGIDVLDYRSFATGDITLDLRITEAQDTGGAGIDTVRGIEEIYSSAFTDVIHGADENLEIYDYQGGDDRFYGGGGNDVLQINRFAGHPVASSLVLDGGDGNDNLIFLGGMLPNNSIGDESLPYRDTVTISGGAGGDYMAAVGARDATLDAGDGDDTVQISSAGSTDAGRYAISLGAGRDELSINWANADAGAVDRRGHVVTDFVAGSNGDFLGLSGIISSALDVALGTFSPFLSGHVRLLKTGADTLLQIDRDGRFGASPWTTQLTLQGTDAFSFAAGNVFALVLRDFGRWERVEYDPVITQIAAAEGGRLAGHDGRDDLLGSEVDDVLEGGAGNDVINGYAGNDVLDGGSGADYMIGGDGDDTYVIDDASDQIIELLDGGRDTLIVRQPAYVLAEGVAVEVLEAANGAGAVDLTGNELDQLIVASDGANVIDGGLGRDMVSYRNAASGVFVSVATAAGVAGDAEGDAYAGIEAYEGSDHGDTMLAGADAVDLYGRDGGDTLIGGDGADRLYGDGGDDTLIGGAGADILGGGAGADVLFGGGGEDRFVFDAIPGDDTIADFESGIDLLDLGGLAAAIGDGGDAFSWIGDRAFGGTAGELRAYAEGGQAYIAGDLDGDGMADFRIVTNVLLNQSDLVLM